jgi:hypothetical protein
MTQLDLTRYGPVFAALLSTRRLNLLDAGPCCRSRRESGRGTGSDPAPSRCRVRVHEPRETAV